ncbi:MAG: cytochrome b [Rhizobiales bacterium]|nr:cytochrome b [Hyphomicrobiales bacterium]
MTYGNLAPDRYPPVSKLLHWLVALCVLITIPVAVWMGRAPEGPLQDGLFNLHKSLGVLILILVLLRIANRFIAGAPAPEPGIERWQRAASSAVHGLLYVLLLAMPIVGYVANSAFGASTPFFGLFDLPPIVGKNEPLSEQLFMLHRWSGYLVAALVVMHVGAALQHYFVHKDGVLQRMLPRALGGR